MIDLSREPTTCRGIRQVSDERPLAWTRYSSIDLPILLVISSYATEAADSRSLAGSGSESESDDEVGAQAPPLTKQISNILNRYPEGGQILKVVLITVLYREI